MHIGIFTMAEPVAEGIMTEVKWVKGAQLRIPLEAIIGYFAMKAGFTHVQVVGTAYRVFATPQQIDKAMLSMAGMPRDSVKIFEVEDL